MMRVAAAVKLSDEQRQKWEKQARGRSVSVRLAQRSKMILLAATGLSDLKIGAELGVKRQTVARWRSRFNRLGLPGIEKDAPRPGRKPKISAKRVKQIIRMTTREKPRDATHWSTRSLAQAAGISEASVRRVWKKHGLKPHLLRRFKLSGTTTLFAALNTLNGKVIATCMPQHRHQEWLKFLRLIDKSTPTRKQLHLIIDNYSPHKHPDVQAWLKKHKRFHIHFTPTSASWLNMIERFFRDLTQ